MKPLQLPVGRLQLLFRPPRSRSQGQRFPATPTTIHPLVDRFGIRPPALGVAEAYWHRQAPQQWPRSKPPQEPRVPPTLPCQRANAPTAPPLEALGLGRPEALRLRLRRTLRRSLGRLHGAGRLVYSCAELFLWARLLGPRPHHSLRHGLRGRSALRWLVHRGHARGKHRVDQLLVLAEEIGNRAVPSPQRWRCVDPAALGVLPQ